MNDAPKPNGPIGRGTGGRFTKGNPGGPGNPYAARVGRLRSALLKAVKPSDMREIIRALVKQAKLGDVASAREVFERCLGRPIEADLLARLEAIESTLAEGNEP